MRTRPVYRNEIHRLVKRALPDDVSTVQIDGPDSLQRRVRQVIICAA